VGVLGRADVLEGREIEVTECGAGDLHPLASQRRVVRLADGGGHGGLAKARGVEEVIGRLLAGVGVLAGHDKGVAAEALGGGRGAADVEGLAILNGEDQFPCR